MFLTKLIVAGLISGYQSKNSFIVLRHGQSVFNKNKILAGWTDVPLSDEGREEAVNMSKKLLGISFDKVISSDLERAVETRNIICKQIDYNKEFIQSCMLKERNYGILQEKNIDNIINTFGEKKFFEWRKSYYGCPPNGESLHQVKQRVGNYYDSTILPLLKEEQNVLLISHSNTLRALFVHIGLHTESSIEHFEINNCEPIQIDIYNKTFKYL